MGEISETATSKKTISFEVKWIPIIVGIAIVALSVVISALEDIYITGILKISVAILLPTAISSIFLYRWIGRGDDKRTKSLIVGIIAGVIAIAFFINASIYNSWTTVYRNGYSFEARNGWVYNKYSDDTFTYSEKLIITELPNFAYGNREKQIMKDFQDSTDSTGSVNGKTDFYNTKEFNIGAYEAATSYEITTLTSDSSSGSYSYYVMEFFKNEKDLIKMEYLDDGSMESTQTANHVFKSIKLI